MTPLDCPVCKARIRPADVNVRRDVAYCGECAHVFTLSEVLEPGIDGVLRYGPPFASAVRPEARGITYQEHDGKFCITARVQTNCGIVVFALLWVSLVTLGTVLSVVPAEAESITFSSALLLVLFNVVSVVLLASAVFSLFGSHRIEIGQERAVLFSGVFGVGRRRSFDPRSVAAIKYHPPEEAKHDEDGNTSPHVKIVSEDDEIRIGAGLSEPRLRSLAVCLRIALLGEKAEDRTVIDQRREHGVSAPSNEEIKEVPGVSVRSDWEGFELVARPRRVVNGILVLLFATVYWALLGYNLFVRLEPGTQDFFILLPFIAPFLIGGLIMPIFVAFLFFGVYRVRVEGSHGELFTGLFGVGRRQRLDPVSVTDVRARHRPGRLKDPRYPEFKQVAIERSVVPLYFGRALTSEQRKAVVELLRRHLLENRQR